MKQHQEELERMRAVLRQAPAEIPDKTLCPPHEEIWAAVRGEAGQARVGELIDHSLACASCGEDWRLALAMVAQAAENETRAGAADATPIRRPGPRRAWLTVAAAAAGLALVAVLFQLRGPGTPPPNPTFRSEVEDSSAIRSLLADTSSLPRERFVLSWTGPEGSLYDIQVSTEDLRTVATARGLTSPEYIVPPEALAALRPRSVLLWQVDALLPDGRRASSRTFRTTLE